MNFNERLERIGKITSILKDFFILIFYTAMLGIFISLAPKLFGFLAEAEINKLDFGGISIGRKIAQKMTLTSEELNKA